MMERQTLTSQKRLPERACGFESRSRHKERLHNRHLNKCLHRAMLVPASHREYGSSPICYWHPRPGERPDLRSIGRRHPALAQRPPPWYRARPAALRRTGCPRCHGRSMDESAYAYLLGLYLGDGHIARGRRGVYVLSIACSDDWPGLLGTARRAMSAVMPASSVCCVQQPLCTAVKSYSKHWPCLFPQHGPGRKHHRKIELDQWQFVIAQKYPGELARGLFHSDGWRGVNRVRRRLASGGNPDTHYRN